MDVPRAKNAFTLAIIYSFGFFLVRSFFRYPLRMTLIVLGLYFGLRYMVYNHPEMLQKGANVVLQEVAQTSSMVVQAVAAGNTTK
jgi:hypothetical protein